MKSPWTASSACKPSSANYGGSGKIVNSGTTCGGLPKTPPTTQTASLRRRCVSFAPESSAKNMCRQTKTSTGRAVNSMTLPRRSEPYGRDRTDAASPPSDRRLARQGEGVLHLGCAGYTPTRMPGRGRAAGGRGASRYLPAGPLRCVTSPHRLCGTGLMRTAARSRAHALSEPLPGVVCGARHRRT